MSEEDQDWKQSLNDCYSKLRTNAENTQQEFEATVDQIIQDLKSKYEILFQQKNTLQNSEDESAQLNQQLVQSNRALNEQLEQLNAQYEEYRKESQNSLDRKDQTLNELKSQIQLLSDENLELKKELQQNNQTWNEQLQQLSRENLELKQQSEQNIQNWNEQLQLLSRELEEKKQELKECSKTICDQYEKENARLSDQITMLQDKFSQLNNQLTSQFVDVDQQMLSRKSLEDESNDESEKQSTQRRKKTEGRSSFRPDKGVSELGLFDNQGNALPGPESRFRTKNK